MVKTMKNKEKYDLNTLKIKWTPQTAERRFFTIKLKSDDSTIFSREITPVETGASAYNAWLEEEYDPKILTDKEKAYLSAVIKPWKNKIKFIEKFEDTFDKERILIWIIGDCRNIYLPQFERVKMYKGMECDKEYTLEELGL